MARKMALWLSGGTRALIKMFTIGRIQEDVIRDAVVTLVEGGEGEVIRYLGGDKQQVYVDREVWYLVSRLTKDLGYKTMDEFVFDAMVNYCVRRGIPVECIERILGAVVE